MYTKEDYEKDLKRRKSWRKRWFDLTDRFFWVRFIALIAGLLLLAYFVNFFVFHHQHFPSGDSGDWGTLGDFFGGILNPIVGIMGLVFLANTLKQNQDALRMSQEALHLNQEELKLSRVELAEARKAQQYLAETEKENLRIRVLLMKADNIYNNISEASSLLSSFSFSSSIYLTDSKQTTRASNLQYIKIRLPASGRVVICEKDANTLIEILHKDAILIQKNILAFKLLEDTYHQLGIPRKETGAEHIANTFIMIYNRFQYNKDGKPHMLSVEIDKIKQLHEAIEILGLHDIFF